METARLIIGIICCVFSPLTCCTSGLQMFFDIENETMYFMYDLLIGILVMIAGITAICTRKNNVGSIITGAIYLTVTISSFTIWNPGDLALLPLYGILCLSLSLFFIISGIIGELNKK